MHCQQLDSIDVSDQFIEAADQQSRGKVLIVEDEHDVVELLDYRLKKERFTTEVAYDGVSACQLVDRERFDLILLDIMLPAKNGWQVCQHIRSHQDQNIATTPIIMVTALGDRHTKIKGIELGADLYIQKPYSVKELLIQSKRLVKARQQQALLEHELANIRAQEQENSDLQSMLFHELYGQLLIISGFCSKLRQNSSTGDLKKNWNYLNAIEKSVVHLTSAADEILLIRKIEAGEIKLPTSIFDFSKLAHEVVALYEKKATSKGIELTVSLSRIGNIQSNKVAMRLIISNLLGNAVKYCPSGSEIVFEAKSNPQTKEVTITVSDNGPGIDKSEQEKIFERFYRGEDARQKAPGTGIGLFAVRELVKAMDGEISLVSSEGSGACFSIRFKAC